MCLAIASSLFSGFPLPPGGRGEELYLLEHEAGPAAGGIREDLLVVPVRREIGGVAQPGRMTVRSDELRRDVDELRLLTEVLHEGHHPPGAGQPVGFQDI